MAMGKLMAGVSSAEITPLKPMFLYGYPGVPRISTGINDPLVADVLVLDNGTAKLCFVSLDVIFISKDIATRVRKQIGETTHLKPENILISATHTHSGPPTKEKATRKYDPVLPPLDEEYISYLVSQTCHAIQKANRSLQPMELAITTADSTDVGGNRRDKNGMTDPEVPLLVLRSTETHTILSILSVCNMHPTVLHEDSTLVSGDFPAYTRMYLNEKYPDSTTLYHTGAEGNQSPRHYTRGNTFSEAKRLGFLLGERIERAVNRIQESDFKSHVQLSAVQSRIELPKNKFLDVNVAEHKLEQAIEKLDTLRKNNESEKEIRTAECDWFGADQAHVLARASLNGEFEQEYKEILPAEITTFSIDGTFFTGWSGEMFVEYSLELKKRCDQPVYIIGLANGTLGGYIVTKEAAEQGGYEAANALISPEAGNLLIKETLKQIEQIMRKNFSQPFLSN